MTTKQMAQHVRLNQWSEVMRVRRESGLSVRAWCAENNIREKTYYYWQNKLRQATCEKIAEQETRLPKTEVIPTGWAQISTEIPIEESITIEIGNSRIRADKNTSPELLAKVCRTLMTLC